MDIEIELLDLIQTRYPNVQAIEECSPEKLEKPICRTPIYYDDAPGVVESFAVAGLDTSGQWVYCIVPQSSRRFWL